MNITNVQLISIDKICPDLEQPRQNFNKIEMSRLRESVLKQGILTPLLLENNYEKDKYLILDGERRYRTALALNIKEAPAKIIIGPLKAIDRMIIRFHAQEQHSKWSPLDKAKAIREFKNMTGYSLSEIAKRLNMFVPKVHGFLSLTEFTEKGQRLIEKSKIQFTYLVFLVRVVKRYQILCKNMIREEIEEKLINKILEQNLSAADINLLSKIVSSLHNEDVKSRYLKDSKMTFKELCKEIGLKEEQKMNHFYNVLIDFEKILDSLQKKYFLKKEDKIRLKNISIKLHETLEK